MLKSASDDPYVSKDPIRSVYTKQMEIGGYFYFKHPKASSITPILRVGDPGGHGGHQNRRAGAQGHPGGADGASHQRLT